MTTKLTEVKREAKKAGWAKWIRSEADERAMLNGCWFDQAAADHVVTFFERFLRHSKGQWAGKSFTPLPWQADEVLRPLFGWKRPSGARRFTQSYIEIPKKNGKSGLCSGLALYLLAGDGEQGAEVYCAASDKDQAGIVYNEAANMVDVSPLLKQSLRLVRSTKRIIYPKTRSVLRALSADVPTKEGVNWNGLIFDELHAQKTRDLWDTLRYGGATRVQPLLIAITTAGFDVNTICYEQHEYAEGVIDGEIEDDSFLGYIRAADSEDDWTDPRVWAKANPSLGETMTIDSFRADFKEAEQSPRKINSFKRYRLNIWTQAERAWLRMDKWKSLGSTPLVESEFDGRECWIGLDLSRRSDITAMVGVFPSGGDEYDVLCRFWVPSATLADREKRDGAPFSRWVETGVVTATPGEVIDYAHIQHEVEAWGRRFQVKEIPYDPWGATHLAQILLDLGLPMVEFRLGFKSYSEPSKKLEELVLTGKLHHGGNPCLEWMAGNTAIEIDPAENIKPSKRKSTKRIDGIVALIMALSRAERQRGGSVYDDRGLIVI